MIIDWVKGAIQQLPMSLSARAFNWLGVLGVSPVATVSERYDLIGTGTSKFSLEGTDDQKFSLEGTSTKKFLLTGI